jgi:hypothetical protein
MSCFAMASLSQSRRCPSVVLTLGIADRDNPSSVCWTILELNVHPL